MKHTRLSDLVNSVTHHPSPMRLASENWREDLHYLAPRMPFEYHQLFHTMTQVELEVDPQNLDDLPPRASTPSS